MILFSIFFLCVGVWGRGKRFFGGVSLWFLGVETVFFVNSFWATDMLPAYRHAVF